ncbi:MAG: membrane-bound lytic murein transglycosylase MltF [Sedimenticola sp.]|jgi:membrane-bound lytic murein transglycosylase F|nr:MAG: membrane-bound lytic murein transglycosylase MltF [Sedimenticola sp.]
MRWLILTILSLSLLSCSIPKPLVERIKEEGTLLVITRNTPTAYFVDEEGEKGFEYELVSLFAERLGVKVKFIFPETFDQIVPMIQRGEAHLAAAGLTVTNKRKSQVRFSPSYMDITQQVVYMRGTRRPKNIEETRNGIFEVVAGSSHDEELSRLKQQHPDLEWTAQQELDSKELLYLVKEQVIDYTVADSNEIALARRFYPRMQVAFDLSEPQPLAWAFQHAEDTSLYDAARDFILEIKENGILEQLTERYYGYVDNLDFVDKRTFRRHIFQRLPELLPFFTQAAEETGIDWKLLAAIGYQESHWNPEAVSPTGVKGVMMLTKATAEGLEVEDRRDPEQSIMGGARYVRLMEERIPERVPEPDRIWLALAGYNIGFGHLEDARILTERNKSDPDKWSDVKQHLPLLAKKKYYTTVKRGFARGNEPVTYVDNIRNYYDMLKWHYAQTEAPPEQEQPKILTSAPSTL